ncbi:Nop52-domain-containing protein [Atractiella rhizophila]|nr:Nop52-domain-containing protein [Atractiella rhizophila]
MATEVQASTSRQAPPLAKHLASNEKHIRDKAVAGLRKYFSFGLSADVGLEEGDWEKDWEVEKRFEQKEMLKLWQGLFYCFWMSDKPLVQQELAHTLSYFILEIRSSVASENRVRASKNALAYIQAFWVTMGKEWSGIDKHRVDKYYLLMRYFSRQTFVFLQRENWEPRLLDGLSALLLGPAGPLSTTTDPKIPSSLCYFLSDIYLSELETSLSQTDPPSSRATPSSTLPLVHLLSPWLQVISKSPHKKFYSQIWDNIYLPLFRCLLPTQQPPTKKRKRDDGEDEEPWKVLIDSCTKDKAKEELGRELLQSFWRKASEGENETTRKWMYDSWREWDED